MALGLWLRVLWVLQGDLRSLEAISIPWGPYHVPGTIPEYNLWSAGAHYPAGPQRCGVVMPLDVFNLQ